jgi:hypothetical protein
MSIRRIRSPITHVANVTTPLMLVNGDADYRTPPADGGEMMFRALKYRKIPTVMVCFPARRTSSPARASPGTASSGSSTSSDGWISG